MARLGAGGAVMLISLGIAQAQTISPVPGFLQDAGGQIPLSDQFSFEPQFQLGLQGNSGNGNPFAYGRALQFRPWIHYDGIAHLTITGATSYIYYFTVPGTSYYRHPEWRFTTFGTLKQQLKGGSLYEQLRFELLNFRASNGNVQHLPRLRSVSVRISTSRSTHPNRIWASTKKRSSSSLSGPIRKSIFKGPGSLPATASAMERTKDSQFCLGSRRRRRFRVADRPSHCSMGLPSASNAALPAGR